LFVAAEIAEPEIVGDDEMTFGLRGASAV